jgi:hypothetical protein
MIQSPSQTASTTQTAPPGSSPQHWGTKSFSFGGVTFIFVAVIAAVLWNVLLKRIRGNLAFRVIVYLSEAAVAVGLSLVASIFEIFRKPTYTPTPTYQPDWHVFFWASLWAAMASYYLAVKLTSITVKEGEEIASKKLAADLDKEKAASHSLVRQRDLLVRITSFARQIVTKKTSRLCALAPAKSITDKQLFDQMNPGLQIQSMVKLIHEFFKPGNARNPNLRLALWLKTGPDATGSERMSIAYSWNGDKEDCFSGRSSDRMRLLNPLGTHSEVVKCYSFPVQTIKIIPNCTKAAEKHEFEFFYPEQRNTVASMLLYKHVFIQDAYPVAVVLLLVSSMEDHFKQEDSDEIKQFLDEMLARIELEWIQLQLIKKIESTREVA